MYPALNLHKFILLQLLLDFLQLFPDFSLGIAFLARQRKPYAFVAPDAFPSSCIG